MDLTFFKTDLTYPKPNITGLVILIYYLQNPQNTDM
jgi:hypothetical protein